METQAQPAPGALVRTIDVATSADVAFALLCEVEKWPVWLSFLRSVRRVGTAPLGLGSEVELRSSIPGDEEQLFEVDRYIQGHAISLVGAYSIRRRIDVRVEAKSSVVRVTVRIDYPRRKLEAALGDSLLHFKGLVEYGGTGSKDALLEDL